MDKQREAFLRQANSKNIDAAPCMHLLQDAGSTNMHQTDCLASRLVDPAEWRYPGGGDTVAKLIGSFMQMPGGVSLPSLDVCIPPLSHGHVSPADEMIEPCLYAVLPMGSSDLWRRAS